MNCKPILLGSNRILSYVWVTLHYGHFLVEVKRVSAHGGGANFLLRVPEFSQLITLLRCFDNGVFEQSRWPTYVELVNGWMEKQNSEIGILSFDQDSAQL